MTGSSHAVQELTRLLCRGLSRLAVVAQGCDDRLDTCLAELRHILRGDMSDLKQMAAVIDAIDERIKQVDREQCSSADQLQRALERVLQQLQALNPPRASARILDQLTGELGTGRLIKDSAGFIVELAEAQSQLLASLEPRASLWNRLFRHGETEAPAPRTDAALGTAAAEGANAEANVEVDATVATPHPATASVATADGAAKPSLEIIPFSHVGAAIAQVLTDLLRQLEAPSGLEESVAGLIERIGNGLNWYELVPTLEQVSVVMLTVLEQDRGQFQSFLLSLNQKLAELHQVLSLSRQHHEGRASDENLFDSTLRGEVAAIGAEILQAGELEQLKGEVSGRLEAILGAMDRRQQSEQLREAAMSEQLQRLATRVRDMEASAVEVGERLAEQRRLALLDSLTQMPNRRAYEERMQHEFERWLRYSRPLTLALCDIDNFKSINDNFGHLAGDKVLRIIARTMRNRLRKADFMARYGGEEFAILMPETTADEAQAVIEAIRSAIAESPFHFRNQPVQITLSAGISSLLSGDTSDDIFERADTALYNAKQNGRNRVEVQLTAPTLSAQV